MDGLIFIPITFWNQVQTSKIKANACRLWTQISIRRVATAAGSGVMATERHEDDGQPVQFMNGM